MLTLTIRNNGKTYQVPEDFNSDGNIIFACFTSNKRFEKKALVIIDYKNKKSFACIFHWNLFHKVPLNYKAACILKQYQKSPELSGIYHRLMEWHLENSDIITVEELDNLAKFIKSCIGPDTQLTWVMRE